jgi:HEAT repeat protein
MGEPAVEPLIAILDDDDWRVRGTAAWALGNLNDERAIPELEKLLDDESGFVKSGAQSAIASIKKEA